MNTTQIPNMQNLQEQMASLPFKKAVSYAEDRSKSRYSPFFSVAPVNPFFSSVQRKKISADEGPLQKKTEPKSNVQSSGLPISGKQTSLPDPLKAGLESLSGYNMDDVRVQYNSSKPAQLHAHAYAQGSQIHIAPGQEKYLPHEAWHVVQQKQGRVKPTLQMRGKVNINDDEDLEREADVMGGKAMQLRSPQSPFEAKNFSSQPLQRKGIGEGVIQRRLLEVKTFRERLNIPEGFYEMPEEDLRVRRLELNKIEELLEIYKELDTIAEPQSGLAIVDKIADLSSAWILYSFTKRQKLPKPLDDEEQFLTQMEAMQNLQSVELHLERDLLNKRIKVDAPEEQVKRNLSVKEQESQGRVVKTGQATGKGPAAKSSSSKVDDVVKGAEPLVGGSKAGTSLTAVVQDMMGNAEKADLIKDIGGGVNSTASGVLSAVKGISDIQKGFNNLDGSPAQVAMGSEQVYKGTLTAASSIGEFANAATRLAEVIGSFSDVPLLGGLLTGPIKLGLGITALKQHSGLASASKKGLDTMKSQGSQADALAISLDHVYVRTIQLATHDAISVFNTGLSLLGTTLALIGGPVAPAGAAIKTTGTIFSGINTFTKALIDSYKAGKAQEAEREYGKDELGAAAKLIKLHPFHAAQTIVERAKRQDKVAVEFMANVGLSEEQMKESSDKDVRALILMKIDESENPKTILQKIKETPAKIVNFFKSGK